MEIDVGFLCGYIICCNASCACIAIKEATAITRCAVDGHKDCQQSTMLGIWRGPGGGCEVLLQRVKMANVSSDL